MRHVWLWFWFCDHDSIFFTSKSVGVNTDNLQNYSLSFSKWNFTKNSIQKLILGHRQWFFILCLWLRNQQSQFTDVWFFLQFTVNLYYFKIILWIILCDWIENQLPAHLRKPTYTHLLSTNFDHRNHLERWGGITQWIHDLTVL